MNIAIYGIGLIGGSLGRAIIKNTSHNVIAADLDSSAMLKAKMLLACHDEIDDENIKEADIVILAVNPLATISLLDKIPKLLKKGAVIIDTCGVKRLIIEKMEAMKKTFPEIDFVGVHPMAGREYSGIAHSTSTLFEKAFFIITPVHSNIETLVKVKALFQEIGCEGVVTASADYHDKVIAYTSQLAHIVSSAYVKSPMSKEHHGFSAGSFKDLTRVAKLNPEMWAQLFLANKDNLVSEINTLLAHIEEYKVAIETENKEKLLTLLAEGVQKKEMADSLAKEKKK